MTISRDNAFRLYVMTAFVVISAAIVATSITAAGGHLIYTLDDPYIHLSVSESILRGATG
ncbi:hypothetical protein Rumeso_03643 [Rubellimicrobium mesophilum DSM 19309]|uniref:Uncharacterized protein n=1 Tax=Rubellimicrobium mesophilum DSM 19309 TaxID=442562 RepID=A0A017HKC1_9RHOB|nr:hypothetical protein [Rubellimicrobium mesophilum]EYD74780.1 hypothetical protein Rumeso_03643 [Rubellimicrobium mesophilum DSM 19309]